MFLYDKITGSIFFTMCKEGNIRKGVTLMEFEKIKSVIVEQLGVDEELVTLDASFVDDLGADSLDVVDLIMGIEEEFDIEIPDEDAENISTVQDAVNYIKAR